VVEPEVDPVEPEVELTPPLVPEAVEDVEPVDDDAAVVVPPPVALAPPLEEAAVEVPDPVTRGLLLLLQAATSASTKSQQ
jgi:hypothetical protein